uniref:Uncharacterized protein n=1 Tax=Oryza brachyantha TaxID=4533 RepID=J3LG07_ORYBR
MIIQMFFNSLFYTCALVKILSSKFVLIMCLEVALIFFENNILHNISSIKLRPRGNLNYHISSSLQTNNHQHQYG